MTTSQIAKLFRAHRSGTYKGRYAYQAKCCCHDDRMASLSVTEPEKGRSKINCFAGCRIEDLLGAKGLTLSDLYADKRTMTPEIRRQMADEQLLEYWVKRRKEAIVAFAATRPKVPRSLWGDAKDPDEFIRNGGNYQAVLDCLGDWWGAEDVPEYANLTKRIEVIRGRIFPHEKAARERESETQRDIREYGDYLWECLPMARLQARLMHERKHGRTCLHPTAVSPDDSGTA